VVLSKDAFVSQIVPRYQVLADEMAELIKGGTFRPGDKLPSVRKASRENQVSVSTVLESYRVLEDRGLIESYPRSGYFVSPPQAEGVPITIPASYRAKPVEIERSRIFETVMDLVENREMIPFGAAAPDDSIIELSKLASLAAAVFRKYGAEASRYTPPTGRRELRLALSRHLLGCGIKAMPDDIVTTHGATEALFLALRAVTKEGDLVAVESPTYFGILNLVRDLGLQAIEIPVCQNSGMSIETLEATLEKHQIAACVVQPNYQNPLGCMMPAENKKRLGELSEEHGFTIIEDDVYGDLGHAGERAPSIALYGGYVIHCGSTSKTVAPGLRVGWVVPGSHLSRIKRLKTVQCPWNATLSELMVAEFFDRGDFDRHLRRIRKIYAGQCARMYEEIVRSFPQSCNVSQPVGGFVLWIEMPEKFDSEAFTVDAILHGISVVPGTIFSPTLQFKSCLRLSCGAAFAPSSFEALESLGRLAASHLSGD